MSIYKRISLYLFAFLIAFISIFTFFIPKNIIKKVVADSVSSSYHFDGSDLIYISALMINAGVNVGSWVITYQVSFDVSPRRYVTFSPTVKTLTGEKDQNITVDGSGSDLTYGSTEFVCLNTSGGQTSPTINESSHVCGGFFVPGTNQNYIPIIFGVEGYFSGDVIGVHLYLSNDMKAVWSYFLNTSLNLKFCYVEYFDSDGNSFYACIPVPNTFQFSDRYYYFDNAFSSDEAYDLGYSQGVEDTLSSNDTAIYRSGYDDGYDVGYYVGHNEGVLESNDYSFLGLFTAIFDAPITVISNFLNFEILGLNLSNFFFGLVTVAIVVFVIKIFT